MLQAHASQVPLATAADFLGSPGDYDPEESWSRAVAAVGGQRAPALGAIAAACADAPVQAPEHLEANALTTVLVDSADGAGWPDAVCALRDHLTGVPEAGRAWAGAGGDRLGAERAPWRAEPATRSAGAPGGHPV